MKKISAGFLAVLFISAVNSYCLTSEVTGEVKGGDKKAAKQPSVTHKEAGVIITIDPEKRTFIMEVETEKDGKKIKVKQNYIWHDVKDKYFKDLKAGDSIELQWYNKTKDAIIAASCKKTADRKEENKK